MTLAERSRTTLEPPLEHELDPSLQRELENHAGEWVAVTRTELIASGPKAETVLKRAKELGYDTPILFRVLRDEGTSYFF